MFRGDIMADKDVQYSQDGLWQIELVAFKINLGVYKAIGTTIRVRHKETQRSWFGLGSSYEAWVERSVESISISNVYEGILPSTVPGAASKSCSESSTSSCDCRLWSVGIGISVDASASPGSPDWGTSSPSPGASLDVRTVRGSGTALIAGESIRVGEVQAG
jgi:hypothetical protein